MVVSNRCNWLHFDFLGREKLLKFNDKVITPFGKGVLVGRNEDESQLLCCINAKDWVGELPNQSKAIHVWVAAGGVILE